MTSTDAARMLSLAAVLVAAGQEIAALANSLNDAAAHQPRTKLDDLRQAAADFGIAVSGDAHVSENDAGRLIGRSPSTLRNWRYAASPLAYRRHGRRIEYHLSELARYLREIDA